MLPQGAREGSELVDGAQGEAHSQVGAGHASVLAEDLWAQYRAEDRRRPVRGADESVQRERDEEEEAQRQRRADVEQPDGGQEADDDSGPLRSVAGDAPAADDATGPAAGCGSATPTRHSSATPRIRPSASRGEDQKPQSASTTRSVAPTPVGLARSRLCAVESDTAHRVPHGY